ncbi:sugar transferase [Streptococcus porcinus]|uniref:Sugar transferase n=2 Tax=Streptococcus porcinus TaxID=1340 RepID=A0A7W0ASH4_STRPO|nr:sugar transferase [Streptococcus porcinus]
MGIYQRFFKRFFDILLSFGAIVLFSWLLLIIAVSVRIKLGSPVIFKQKRPGLYGNIFELYKFRTMTNQCDEKGNLLPDNVRLTNFGKWLRSTSLDELPELFNILKGDMSIIGPRPLLESYLSLYSKKQARRHEVRPGLTGYAQVNGRNALTWTEKFILDTLYVDNISFWGDVKILVKTVQTVLKREGISSNSSETMEEFRGNE